MQDRPTYEELLAAIERFLDEEIVPNTPGARAFHARVAANAIRTIRREVDSEERQLAAEWTGLDGLLGPAERPGSRAALRDLIVARNSELCERIRAGEADAGVFRSQVFGHVRRTVRDKLLVSNPQLLQRSRGQSN